MEYIILAVEVLVLVSMSAIYSGLNVALMSLNINDLKRKAKLGNAAAKRVVPLRQNSHLSLASILFANVAVISATSLVLDHHLAGIVAGLLSTLLIVVFGEVLPQAWFARYALRFCAFFAPLVRVTVIVTYPVSKPLQLLLDKLLGDEANHFHSRRELGIIISEHLHERGGQLDEDEVEIIRSTLLLSEKRVRDIMTPIGKVYWLTQATIIDADRIDQIKDMGWSRIPILNKEKTVCKGVLLMKDMVDVDFDNSPMPVMELPLHQALVVGSMTALDTMFRKFIAAKSHLVLVEKDDKIVGIITIEDLVEEILGHEIADETDHMKHRQ